MTDAPATDAPSGATPADDSRELVLRAFEARARAVDGTGVRMSDVARDAGISTKTLYRLVDGKDELVMELVRRWIDEQAVEEERHRRGSRTPLEKILVSVDSWARHGTRFSPAFLAELRKDHPAAWELFEQARRATRGRWRAFLEPHIRSDQDLAVAVEAFDAVVRRALDPTMQERLGMRTREALRRSVEVWAHGALAMEHREEQPAGLGAPGNHQPPERGRQ